MISSSILSFIAACYLAASFAQPLNNESTHWEHFKKSFGKTYKSEHEEDNRRMVFLSNLQTINEHNKLYEQGKTTFTMKINEFGDLTPAEFKKLMYGYKFQAVSQSDDVYRARENEDIPRSVDWRTLGAVTPVKNQKTCGSCWAFSATGSLEGQTFLKKGKVVSLSEQNLMDCSTAEGNNGCNGGWMDWAFTYIKKTGGIDTEASYPYEAKNNICRFKKGNIGATLTGFTDIEAGKETSLQSAIANVGPISVAINAETTSFRFYSSGVYYNSDCSPSSLDHAVLAVGYDSNSKGDYYIVKNSWGESWGDNGYILMSRNKNNNCGIASKASYPNV